MFYNFILKNIFVFIALLLLIVFLATLEIYDFIESRDIITVPESLKLLNENKSILIDLRSNAEYNKCHIINSINLPLSLIEDNVDVIKKYQNKTIIFIHLGSNVSKKAIKKIGLNYNIKCKYFKNGLTEWLDQGMPIKREVK